MENLVLDLYALLVMAMLVLGLGLLIAGAQNKVVIYYDWKEMLMSFLSPVLLGVALLLFKSEPFRTDLFNGLVYWIVSPAALLGGMGCAVLSFNSAIKHNRNFRLGLFVGLFKIGYAFLVVFLTMKHFGRILDHRAGLKETAPAALIVGLLVWISRAMINGPEVYERKGWARLEPTLPTN